LTAFATRNLMSLTLVVVDVQSVISTLYNSNSGIRKKDRGCHLPCAHARDRKTWKPSLIVRQIESADLQRGTSIVDRDRGKANVVGSRDGETRGVLVTIIAVVAH